MSNLRKVPSISSVNKVAAALGGARHQSPSPSRGREFSSGGGNQFEFTQRMEAYDPMTAKRNPATHELHYKKLSAHGSHTGPVEAPVEFRPPNPGEFLLFHDVLKEASTVSVKRWLKELKEMDIDQIRDIPQEIFSFAQLKTIIDDRMEQADEKTGDHTHPHFFKVFLDRIALEAKSGGELRTAQGADHADSMSQVKRCVNDILDLDAETSVRTDPEPQIEKFVRYAKEQFKARGTASFYLMINLNPAREEGDTVSVSLRIVPLQKAYKAYENYKHVNSWAEWPTEYDHLLDETDKKSRAKGGKFPKARRLQLYHFVCMKNSHGLEDLPKLVWESRHQWASKHKQHRATLQKHGLLEDSEEEKSIGRGYASYQHRLRLSQYSNDFSDKNEGYVGRGRSRSRGRYNSGAFQPRGRYYEGY